MQLAALRSQASAPRRIALFSALVLLAASTATAGVHTWDVREVFSNHDGTI